MRRIRLQRPSLALRLSATADGGERAPRYAFTAGRSLSCMAGRVRSDMRSLVQNSDWTQWDETTRPSVVIYPIDAIDIAFASNFFRARAYAAQLWTDERIDLLARAVAELARAWNAIPSILTPRLSRWPTAAQPNPAWAVTVPGGSASIGVVGTSNRQTVATTVAHLVGHNTTVQVPETHPQRATSRLYSGCGDGRRRAPHDSDSPLLGALTGLAPAGGVS